MFVKDLHLANPGFKLSFGQMSEIFFMIIIPLLLARLGAKRMIVISMLAWVLRYGLFAAAAESASLWMVMTAIIVHGICFDFLYVVGQIYVDRKAPPEARAQAQGLFVFVTTGLGQLAGTLATGWLFNRMVEASKHSAGSWERYWYIHAGFSLAVTLVFLFFFNDRQAEPDSVERS